MAQSSHDDEQKSPTKHHNILSILSSKAQPTNPNIRQCDALCPIPLESTDNLLEIRSTEELINSQDNTTNSSPLITINVSGTRFQTHLSTLETYPDTLLGNETKRKQYWNSHIREYFFDRPRTCFESILYYYQTKGRLRRPEYVPLDTFLEEITFFQLGNDALKQIHQTENIDIIEQIALPKILWRRYLWFYFEFPQYSLLSRIIYLLSMSFTILSCLSLAIETLPIYNDHWENLCKQQGNLSVNSTIIPRCPELFQSPFFIIQTICVTYFLIEFLARLISTPSYIKFCLTFFNWIDLGTILSYFIYLAIELFNKQINLSTNILLGIRLLRIIRFIRIFKIYLIFKKFKPLRVLSSTIKESLIDFIIMIIILTLVAFIFGTALYFVEQQKNGDVFDSIPKATYWGIITITGVGYGDMYPITALGQILTCLCSLVGAGMMAILVSVLVDRYERIYDRKMYIPELEISSAEFDGFNNNNQMESEINTSRQKLSSFISHYLSSVYKRLKSDQGQSSSQSYNIKLSLTFDDENNHTNDMDHILTTLKEKLIDIVGDNHHGIHLQVVEEKK